MGAYVDQNKRMEVLRKYLHLASAHQPELPVLLLWPALKPCLPALCADPVEVHGAYISSPASDTAVLNVQEVLTKHISFI